MVSSFIQLWKLAHILTYISYMLSMKHSYLTVHIAVVGLLTFATLKKVFSPVVTWQHNMMVPVNYQNNNSDDVL